MKNRATVFTQLTVKAPVKSTIILFHVLSRLLVGRCLASKQMLKKVQCVKKQGSECLHF